MQSVLHEYLLYMYMSKLSTTGYKVQYMDNDGELNPKILKLTPAGNLELFGTRARGLLSNVFSRRRSLSRNQVYSAIPRFRNSTIIEIHNSGAQPWKLNTNPNETQEILDELNALSRDELDIKRSNPRLRTSADIFLTEPNNEEPRPVISENQQRIYKETNFASVYTGNRDLPDIPNRKGLSGRRIGNKHTGTTPRKTVLFDKYAPEKFIPTDVLPMHKRRKSILKTGKRRKVKSPKISSLTLGKAKNKTKKRIRTLG